jgi:hypothetical protein
MVVTCLANSTINGGVIFFVPDVRVDVPIFTTMSMNVCPMNIGRDYTLIKSHHSRLPQKHLEEALVPCVV